MLKWTEGTFALVFVGGGSVIVAESLLEVAVAHGLILAIMVSALGHISGAHFNPAVTLGFVVTRRIEPAVAVVYWVSQFLGGILAALLLWAVFPTGTRDDTALGAPAVSSAINSGQGFLAELIMTFFLVFVVFATAVDPRGAFKYIAGFAIGLTIAADILVGGPLTGAAMNPARAFGPQLVANFWSDGWVYYLGPAVGGVIAAIVYDRLYLRSALELSESTEA